MQVFVFFMPALLALCASQSTSTTSETSNAPSLPSADDICKQQNASSTAVELRRNLCQFICFVGSANVSDIKTKPDGSSCSRRTPSRRPSNRPRPSPPSNNTPRRNTRKCLAGACVRNEYVEQCAAKVSKDETLQSVTSGPGQCERTCVTNVGSSVTINKTRGRCDLGIDTDGRQIRGRCDENATCVRSGSGNNRRRPQGNPNRRGGSRPNAAAGCSGTGGSVDGVNGDNQPDQGKPVEPENPDAPGADGEDGETEADGDEDNEAS